MRGFFKNSYSLFSLDSKSALTTTRVPHKNKIFAHVPLRRSQWHDYFVYHHRVVVVVVVVVEEDNVRRNHFDDDNNKNKNFDLSSSIVIFFKQHEEKKEEEEEEDIFEVIRENLPFFIGGMVAGTFGLSITDDSSPLKGWVEDRRKSKMSSLSQNINKLVDPRHLGHTDTAGRRSSFYRTDDENDA